MFNLVQSEFLLHGTYSMAQDSNVAALTGIIVQSIWGGRTHMTDI
jgi:hypothetical protein